MAFQVLPSADKLDSSSISHVDIFQFRLVHITTSPVTNHNHECFKGVSTSAGWIFSARMIHGERDKGSKSEGVVKLRVRKWEIRSVCVLINDEGCKLKAQCWSLARTTHVLWVTPYTIPPAITSLTSAVMHNENELEIFHKRFSLQVSPCCWGANWPSVTSKVKTKHHYNLPGFIPVCSW